MTGCSRSPRGAVLHLWLGWSDSGLVDKGTYTVDETEHSGAPDVLSIRARSADLRKGLKVKRERSWSNPKTLGDVLTDIALGNNLKPVLAPALAGLPILQLDQANESDANLLTRLGEDFDAVATVKAGCLLCLPAGGGKTASGLALPHITLTRQDGDQHRYLQADRDSYDGVRAYFYDVNSAKKQGGDRRRQGRQPQDLRHTCDRQSALRAARAEWNRLQRGSATLSRARQGPAGPDPGTDIHPAGREDGDRRDHLVRRQCAAQPQRRRRLHHQPGWKASYPGPGQRPGRRHRRRLHRHHRLLPRREERTEKTITAGDQSTPRRLRYLYSTKASAKRAVDREWKRLQGQRLKAGSRGSVWKWHLRDTLIERILSTKAADLPCSVSTAEDRHGNLPHQPR